VEADALARLRERPQLAAFIGVFASVLCGFMAVGAVLPVLPQYVRGPIGAGDVAVGIVTGAFAVTAIVGRPVAGRVSDAHGRRLVVVVGLLLAGVGGALYLLPLGVPGLVLARLVLGIGDGWMFTAGAIWSVDLAPEERRGQAIGLFGLAVWGGLSAGPVLGQALLSASGYDAVFVFAAVMPVLGAAVARRVPDRHVAIRVSDGPRGPLIPRGVRLPGIALALANIGYGTVTGFIVLHLRHRGIGHGAAAFTAFAIAVVLTRLLAGRLPDRIGPQRTAAGAFVAETAGLVLIGMAHSWAVAGIGAVVMGMGFSLLFPSLALIAIARTDGERRGTAMGAFTAFFDLGVGVGAPLAGAISSLAGYPAAFWTAAGCAAVGALMGAVQPAGSATGREAPGPVPA
jgi:MFS family permease